MPHAFDTGLAAPQLTLLQNGVVALLSPLLDTADPPGYLRAVEAWGGLVRGYTDDPGIDLAWATLNGRSPAILVGLGDVVGKAAGMGGFNFTADVELVLYHHNNHQASITRGRSQLDARGAADTTRNPGLHVMRAHALELVIGQRVGAALATNPVGEKRRSTPSIKQVVFAREEELRTENTLTLWAQRFRVTMGITINPNRGVTQMLEELRTVVRPSEVADSVVPDDPNRGDVVLETKYEPT